MPEKERKIRQEEKKRRRGEEDRGNILNFKKETNQKCFNNIPPPTPLQCFNECIFEAQMCMLIKTKNLKKFSLFVTFFLFFFFMKLSDDKFLGNFSKF